MVKPHSNNPFCTKPPKVWSSAICTTGILHCLRTTLFPEHPAKPSCSTPNTHPWRRTSCIFGIFPGGINITPISNHPPVLDPGSATHCQHEARHRTASSRPGSSPTAPWLEWSPFEFLALSESVLVRLALSSQTIASAHPSSNSTVRPSANIAP